ncbi:MAG: Ku protein, partial [Longimicrobiales bacterium]
MPERMTDTDLRSRAIWSGTITFGLVSVPVHLFPASRSAPMGLRMVDADGTPLQRRYVCPEHDQEVEWDDLVRGYEIADHQFVVVTDDELEALEPKRSREIDLRQFVPLEQLDPRFFERGYYLVPADESTKAYQLLASIMEKSGRAGIATFVM